MRWATVVAAMTALAVAVSGSGHNSAFNMLSQRRSMMDSRRREAAEYAHRRNEENDRIKRESNYLFLNEKTEAFAVNGSQLPNITFDIGESYAGLLPIDNTNQTEMFFWFFPSTNPAAKNEIVIWFTGGPGCSSMEGLLEENGPFTWQPGTYAPQPNPWGWNLLSNVVWIDQPIGTGFDIGNPTATNETKVADQFRGFWKNFVDTFDMHGYSVYITGESYAGLYCPYIAGGMIDQNDTKYFDVKGMIIYDGVISNLYGDVVTVPFIDYWAGLFPLNESTSDAVHENHASCGYANYLDKYLVFPPAGLQPNTGLPGVNNDSTEYLPGCDVLDQVLEAMFLLNPCFDYYGVSVQCPILYDPLGFSNGYGYQPPGSPEVYFNRSDVKEALHVPVSDDWNICKNGVLNEDDSLPSILVQIPKVIEATNNVQIVHGVLDLVLFMNITLLAIQNMTWNGELGFQAVPDDPIYVPYHPDGSLGTIAAAGVLGTSRTERGLTFLGVALSGHEGPAWKPSVAYRQLEVLLGRVENFQSLDPFTTDANNTVQPDVPLGPGTVPL
ncbi:Alpha/Beta hydrolase protein [Xylariales sp. PMI_506]|nr:Alpha/Beta hydrolase protein [Xylariales sp. PMI_506]